MQRSRTAVLASGLVIVALAATGCATGAAPAETPAAVPSSEPSPTPTVEPIALGPAEMPPLAFDGDCEAALPAAELAEIVGVAVTPNSAERTYLANVGALECTWDGADGREVGLVVVPRAAFEGEAFPTEYEAGFFGQCSYDAYTCDWQGGDSSVWISASFVASRGTQEEANAWGEAIGARVLENRAADPGVPWTRDRTGWWWPMACAQVNDAVGAQLGQPLGSLQMGWDADRPSPAYAIAITTAGQSRCWLGEPGSDFGSFWIHPGEGARPAGEGYEAIELGVPGITASVREVEDGRGRPTYMLSDGVNRIELWVSADDAPVERILVAVAAAAASDFQ